MTVRGFVREIQVEVRETVDLLPDRAAELLNRLSALYGNISDEIRAADAAYAVVLLQHLETSEKANRAKIRAETTPEFARAREARDTRELAIELSRALKYFLRVKSDELRAG